MTKGDWNRAHMLANLLYRIGTQSTPSSVDVERVNFLYTWLKQTGREDVITEAERLCNLRINACK